MKLVLNPQCYQKLNDLVSCLLIKCLGNLCIEEGEVHVGSDVLANHIGAELPV